jgi:predicted nucleic acid-binding protein
MTLVDTNVILDVISADLIWMEWSLRQMARRSSFGRLIVNEIVYAELSAGIDTEADVEHTLADLELQLERVPTRAMFLAGQAYRDYRAHGGIRTGVLPDFFIGGHAQVVGIPILTRDMRRYRTYFPDVTLITPATD